ncbi:MAG: Deoxyribonucleoside 5'-monophosphate N-glycosidase [candidate division CPR2 bacterium GW2011_GWC2_39_10]|uniref:Putative 2'-deoxynucleoside 5'-phosphate N-hydrolase 1 n=1 Tax=candidate division CPR2 bacterium GW2011_GWC2_39_10 TaxID=1618345 RepID=A0A0G0M287_UNCC2|nr:MAG: Deoxyribonucleoside 5'-monophosphate N-glycosidase [candidate division CPR2 bacterium GW2011_GWC2_39_10]
MKAYFAGSIRGGRDEAEKYQQIIGFIQNHASVLTEHVGDTCLSKDGEKVLTEKFIYKRDINWLLNSDCVIADVTVPSLGVGLEIGKAIELNKKLLCLYEKQEGRKLSAMIMGCPEIEVFEYEDLLEVKKKIDEFFK